MIATLRGRLFTVSPDRLVIDVGGVGYEVFLSRPNLERLPESGGDIFLYIHTEVREDALTLYGFPELAEKRMFLLLVGVSGVGPKLALNILSGIRAGELVRAIGAEDIGRLTRIGGVGKKTAERLCLELKDKVQFLPEFSPPLPQNKPPSPDDQLGDAVSALVNLGYPAVQAREAMEAMRREIPPEVFGSMRLEELLRTVLRSLA